MTAPLAGTAPIFAALGDPVRLAIVARLSEDGPLATIALLGDAGGVSRQGVTKHLRVLEEVGLVESRRAGRDRQWQLRPQAIAASRTELERISALWDARLERLRVLVEEDE
jgi:DNA-binding transcriptional ArsR family regulator